MRIEFLTAGRTGNAPLRKAADDYIAHYTTVSERYVAEERTASNPQARAVSRC